MRRVLVVSDCNSDSTFLLGTIANIASAFGGSDFLPALKDMYQLDME